MLNFEIKCLKSALLLDYILVEGEWHGTKRCQKPKGTDFNKICTSLLHYEKTSLRS